MKPYTAMSASGILSLGVIVDRFGDNQKEAYLQSCLVRLRKQIGNIDGIIGRNTRLAIESLGIDSTLNTDKILIQVEDFVQKKFSGEFSDVPVDNIV